MVAVSTAYHVLYLGNNALGGRGSRPPGAWLKHRARDKFAAGRRPVANLSKVESLSVVDILKVYMVSPYTKLKKTDKQ